MEWSHFVNDLINNPIHKINNNSDKNIVLFGSCHMATIGYMLNKLLNYEYNIYIIISWFFKKKGIENFDMCDINNRITNIVSKCDVFINHFHLNDYDINASTLTSLVDVNSLKLLIPNYRLDYTNNNYLNSLNFLNFGIEKSNFSEEFNFVTKYHKNIMFFNTTNHPTHYFLFLQSQCIKNKILNNGETISVESYFDENNRSYYLKEFKKCNNFIVLPGKERITKKISIDTGIDINADFFD